MSQTPSNPIYEKYQADWARRAIARRLGIKIIGKRKDVQWHSIVCRLCNLVDHYENLQTR